MKLLRAVVAPAGIRMAVAVAVAVVVAVVGAVEVDIEVVHGQQPEVELHVEQEEMPQTE